MKYWPTTALARSPLLSQLQQQEVLRIGQPGFILPESTMHACHEAAFRVPACTSLGLIFTENIGFRRVCLTKPRLEDFLLMERGGFIDDGGVAFGFGFIMDALH